MYNFHLLTLPHTRLSKEFCSCAFTIKCWNMAKMMEKMGHKLFVYGTEGGETPYGEFINTFSKEDFERVYPLDHKQNLYDSTNEEGWKIYCDNTIKAVQKNRTGKDILLISYGYAHKPIKDVLGIPAIEMGIGYPSSMNNCYRVFESYAWMYNHYGQDQVRADWSGDTEARNQAICPSQYDIVIPNYFDEQDFEYNETPEDYFLFIGRPSRDKGWMIAVDVCSRMGKKLKLAGQNGKAVEEHLEAMKIEGKNIEGIEHVGWIGVEERKKLIKNAKALFVPTLYVEPFAGVQIEALLSGTPLITSDNGVFNETNKHGITGYRCRVFQDYVNAVDRIEKIPRETCRKTGMIYSINNVRRYYNHYFERIIEVMEGDGWYSKENNALEYAVWDPTAEMVKKGVL